MTWDGLVIESFILPQEATFIINSLKDIDPWNSFEKGHHFNNDRYKVIYQEKIKEKNKELYAFIVALEEKIKDLIVKTWQDPHVKKNVNGLYFALRQNNFKVMPHRDADMERIPGTEQLRYSTLLYLNEDFEGGHIKFSEYNIEIQPRSGLLIIFDSRYLHEVTPQFGSPRWTGLAFWGSSPKVAPKKFGPLG